MYTHTLLTAQLHEPMNKTKSFLLCTSHICNIWIGFFCSCSSKTKNKIVSPILKVNVRHSIWQPKREKKAAAATRMLCKSCDDNRLYHVRDKTSAQSTANDDKREKPPHVRTKRRHWFFQKWNNRQKLLWASSYLYVVMLPKSKGVKYTLQ